MGINTLSFFILPTLITLISLISPYKAHAQVVINEIYPNPEGDDNKDIDKEWIELFNTSEESINLTDWYISFQENSDRQRIILSDTIGGGSYLKIVISASQGWMRNKEGDSVRLYKPGEVNFTDGYSYGDSSEEKITWGRDPNGTGGWARMQSATPGGPNSGKIPEPTATPTPDPTSTPEPTSPSEPTNTPTPQFSPTPTRKPTPTSATKNPDESKQASAITQIRQQILAAETESKAATISATATDSKPQSPNYLTFVLIGSGITLLLVSSYPFLKPIIQRKISKPKLIQPF